MGEVINSLKRPYELQNSKNQNGSSFNSIAEKCRSDAY